MECGGAKWIDGSEVPLLPPVLVGGDPKVQGQVKRLLALDGDLDVQRAGSPATISDFPMPTAFDGGPLSHQGSLGLVGLPTT